MNNIRTREEIDEMIDYLQKNARTTKDDLTSRICTAQVYALMWAKGFVSGYKF